MRLLSPQPPPRTITIELTEEEATVLCALVGGVGWNFDKRAGRAVSDFYHALDNELPDRNESFHDFFEGGVVMK